MAMNALRQHPLLFAAIALALVLGGVGIVLWRLWRRLMRSDQERRRAAEELNRRLSELFSLQELSYVLSDSIELDRIVEQVVRYAVRVLDAQGALLALLGDGPDDPLRVAAAEGTLSDLRGRTIHSDDAGLLVRSTGREHLELIRNSGTEPTEIVQGFQAAAAAAVPLRSHGTVIGTLLITDPREGMIVPEDIRLLSTLATHAAVVIANARFFEMVRRAKDQWETAFDALSEGIAVVDDEGCGRRAARQIERAARAPGGDAPRRTAGPARRALRAAAPRPARERGTDSRRRDRAQHRRHGRRRHRAAGARNPARAKRKARGRRPAGLRCRARAQQSPDVDRRAFGVPARAERAGEKGPRPPAGHSGAGGAGRPHRAQPADVRAQRLGRARTGRSQ